MEEKSIKRKKEFKYKKQVGVSLICLSLLLLIFSTFEFVYPIKAFLLGTFGIMLYPLLVFTLIFCAALVSGRKFMYSAKYIVYLFLCFFFFMCVLHVVLTNFSGQVFNSYGEYLTACYNTLYTPGGLLIGIFTYPVTSLLHNIAGIVVYAIAFIISLYFVLSYLDSVKQNKKPEVKQERTYETFNTITSDLEQLDEMPEEDEELYDMDDAELFEETDDEEDIFIKDEVDEEQEKINEELNEARRKLGLIPEDEKEEDDEEEDVATSKASDTWGNRGVKKPIKVVYDEGEKPKPKPNPLYEKDKEYLKTLYSYNFDSNNPIINAESFEDYEEKMRLYKERNAKPFNRELDVNQTLVSQGFNVVGNQPPQQPVQTPPQQPKNIFDNNFGIEPSNGFNNLPINRDKPLNQNANNNGFNQGNTLNTNSFNVSNYNPTPSYNNNTVNLGGNDDEIISTIEGLETDFIKPTTFETQKVSPLNPTNFGLSQDKIVREEVKNDSSQRFLSEEPNIATPFDTTKLSDGDVSTSLNKTYNLPKGLMASNASAAASAPAPVDPVRSGPNYGNATKYIKPPIDLLQDYINDADQSNNAQHNIAVLEQVLEQFGIPAKVIAVRRGAAFTRYELNPPPGISVRKIHAHASDIALALAAKGDIRIETPIKGKSAVGIEVPNEKIDTVGLKKIIASDEFNKQKSPLSFALGEDVDGRVYTCNLAKMPHLLVAGSTGSGKSVCLNTLLISLIYRTSPEDLRIILVDPKRVEFAIYNNLPHLLLPKAITEPKKALNAFDWLINEMERRYMAFQDCYVKNIIEYNNQQEVISKQIPKMPYIILIVDELADLVVTTNKKELEEKIIRLTQKARAAGIHLILATQRPSVDIITGTIKINLPARIAFAVSQFVDSKTILDQGGAEKLLGRGDMLYSPSDGEPTRVQGAFVDTPEVKRVVDFVKDNNQAFYDDQISRIINSDGGPAGGNGNPATVGASANEEFDTLMPDALKLVIENGQASISMLQRRFSIGFSRAARIIDQMEMARFISSSDGSKPRNVFITMDDYNQIYGNR